MTTIYLRPGLDTQQRKDALARLRRNARLGYAPPLPVTGVARAMAADRIAGTLRSLLAVLQCHPLGIMGLVGVLAGAAVSYTTLVTYTTPAGSRVPVASLPVPGGGNYAGGQVTGAGLAGSALSPLGVRPRHWMVPEVRPRRQLPGRGRGHPSGDRGYPRRSGWHGPGRPRLRHWHGWRGWRPWPFLRGWLAHGRGVRPHGGMTPGGVMRPGGLGPGSGVRPGGVRPGGEMRRSGGVTPPGGVRPGGTMAPGGTMTPGAGAGQAQEPGRRLLRHHGL